MHACTHLYINIYKPLTTNKARLQNNSIINVQGVTVTMQTIQILATLSSLPILFIYLWKRVCRWDDLYKHLEECQSLEVFEVFTHQFKPALHALPKHMNILHGKFRPKCSSLVIKGKVQVIRTGLRRRRYFHKKSVSKRIKPPYTRTNSSLLLFCIQFKWQSRTGLLKWAAIFH